MVLTIQWDVPGGNNASNIWLNSKKLANFISRHSVGSTQMTLGDLNPNGISPMDGSIGAFLLYTKKILSDSDIKIHHEALGRWFNIDHDPITI